MRPLLTVAAVLCASALLCQPTAPQRVGPLPGGGFLLPSGWRLQPAGDQVAVGSLPLAGVLSRDGRYLLVLNCGYDPPSLSVVDVATRKETSRTPVPDAWLGLSLTPRGDRVYVGGGSQATVYEFGFSQGRLQPARAFPVVDAQKRTAQDFAGDVALSPDGRLLYVAELFRNSIAVINPQSGRVIDRFPTGRRPYRILFHPDGKSFLVSSWADGSVLRHETDGGRIMDRVRLALHPTDMIWVPGAPKTAPGEDPSPFVARIFVATSNTNTIHAVGVTAANDLSAAEVVNLAMTPRQPAGMTPSAFALDAGSGWLYVACSDANEVTVVDVTEQQSRVLGMVPVGWYPTAVRPMGGGKIAVVNGRGSGAGTAGTVSFIQVLGGEALDISTRAVFVHAPYRDDLLDDAGVPETNPIPSRPGGTTPIEHVVYVIKGGLTYDQVLGDVKEGYGDPSLATLGERITPNHHKLAREFVLLDNFYANGDAGADGYRWSVAAIASDFVRKLAPGVQSRRGGPRSFEETEPGAAPPAGYLWGSARLAGVAVKTYDRAASDMEQAKVFLKDLADSGAAGRVPRLSIIRLSGAQAEEHDRALGMIVEGVSKSAIWPKSAIFVLEAGAAPAGRDHVSPYRVPAFVISPYARRRVVDSTFYNTAAMLRTIELVLGLRPLTHFDAGARPLWSCFQATPDLTPFVATP